MYAFHHPLVSEVAQALGDIEWALVGGMMVQVHCAIAGVGYGRSTSDVDIVALVGQIDLGGVKERLEGSGFVPYYSLHQDLLYRFDHPGGWHVDVMVKDDRRIMKWGGGYLAFQCPGSKSALGVYKTGESKEVLEVAANDDAVVKTPNVWSAIALKGHAFRQPGINVSRHVSDALALFACSTRYPGRELTKSERIAVNYILSSERLSELEVWDDLYDDVARERAMRGILAVRQDCGLKFPPEFALLEQELRDELFGAP